MKTQVAELGSCRRNTLLLLEKVLSKRNQRLLGVPGCQLPPSGRVYAGSRAVFCQIPGGLQSDHAEVCHMQQQPVWKVMQQQASRARSCGPAMKKLVASYQTKMEEFVNYRR